LLKHWESKIGIKDQDGCFTTDISSNMPQRELDRLQAVNRFLKIQVSKEKELQEIVEFASKICNTPTALITFIDKDTQYIRFKQSFDFDTTLRSDAFCDHVIDSGELMVVSNALEDKRFVDNPLVNGEPHIRFYAGAPLTTQDGYHLGSLCVIDQTPKELSIMQRGILQVLAKQVIQLLEFDSSVNLLREQFLESKRYEIELRSFFESSIDSHLLLGRAFEILAYNKSWENYVKDNYGLLLERGKDMGQYLHPENSHEFYQEYAKALEGKTSIVKMRLKGRQWRMVKFEPAVDVHGDIIGVSINANDITKWIEQEEIVAARNAALREIAFIQSHELRRPVATILGMMNLLNMEGYLEGSDELKFMNDAVKELDEKIKLTVNYIDEMNLPFDAQ
jgi:hypothetical protein